MTTHLKALALYNNEGDDSDELSFKINDLLTILAENWQDGWHLCQLGDKKGVAPANYLQILAKPAANCDVSNESIYDSPKSHVKNSSGGLYMNTSARSNLPSEGDAYVYADYQNTGFTDSDNEDIYQNTSMAATLNDSHTSHASLHTPSPKPPARPIPPVHSTPTSPARPKINYPAAPPKYQLQNRSLLHQTSEYMDMEDVMGRSDYIDIDAAGGDDYDEVAANSYGDYDEVPITKSSNGSIKSSNGSLPYPSSTQIYPDMHRSSDSLHSNKLSAESIKSYDSGISSSRQDQRGSPPTLPDKSGGIASARFSPKGSSSEDADYMVPPSLTQVDKRKSDHDYFNPPQSPIKPPLVKTGSNASEVIVLDEGVEYMTASELQKKKNGGEKKKKKSSAGVDKLFGSLTLKKNKPAPGSGLKKSQTLSKSLEQLNKNSVSTLSRPLPTPPGFRTKGEVSRGPHQGPTEYRARPLPPTPASHELQDYAEIEEDYADLDEEDAQKTTLERQRSRSVTNSLPVDLFHPTRRHSSPNRPDLLAGGEEDDELHDYSEVPEMSFPPNHNPTINYNSCQSISSTESTGSSAGGYPMLPRTTAPRLPASQPPRLPSHPPPQLGTPRPPLLNPDQVVRNMKVQHPNITVQHPGNTPPQHPGNTPPQHPGNTPPQHPGNTPPQHPGNTPPQHPGNTTRAAASSIYSPGTLAMLPPTTYITEPVSPGSTEVSSRQGISSAFNEKSKSNQGTLPTVELCIDLLPENDKALISEHCEIISSNLLRKTTEQLIKLKACTDERDVEHYIDMCKLTGSSVIDIIRRLTAVEEGCQDASLRALTAAHRNTLRDGLKLLIETIKIAKVQYPAQIAHNDMIRRRNDLITSVREVKTFVVKLLHPVV